MEESCDLRGETRASIHFMPDDDDDVSCDEPIQLEAHSVASPSALPCTPPRQVMDDHNSKAEVERLKREVLEQLRCLQVRVLPWGRGGVPACACACA
jgi:hypothetical protein